MKVPNKEQGYEVIQRAVGSLGIRCELTGRNDLTVLDGRKFSGNAFRYENGVFLHHGTLLISSDLSNMSRYLNPSFEKIESKGVKSTSARVINLSELKSDLSVDSMKEALINSVSELVGKPRICYSEANEASDAFTRKYASDEWIYGTRFKSDVTLRRRFDWGEIELLLCIQNGRVISAKVYSDALDIWLPRRLEEAITGEMFSPGNLSRRTVSLGGEHGSDISDWGFVNLK